MIDLHTHSIFSDGELLPSELVRRAVVIGYTAIAITDHVDSSNIDFVVPRIVRVCDELNRFWEIIAIPGAEITHVPPETIPSMVKMARELGAKIVVVHGESPIEPVITGTNMAAIESGADILAHPGFITDEEIALAHERGIHLELTSRRGHCISNGFIVTKAMLFGTKLVINTDAHSPADLISDIDAERILLSAGLPKERIIEVFNNSKKIVEEKSGKI